MEKWFTYILYSLSIDRYYVGSTDDLEWRLERHNMGWGKYTKRGIPWRLVHYEIFPTKTESLGREREIKKKKSRRHIENLIHQAGGRPDIK